MDNTIANSYTVEKWKKEDLNWEKLRELLINNCEDHTLVNGLGFSVDGIRRGSDVYHRSLLTLDADYAPDDFWNAFKSKYEGFEAVVHSTHNHILERARYRLIMPLSRNLSSREYEALATYVAGTLNVVFLSYIHFDSLTILPWPSAPKGGKRYVKYQTGDVLDVDKILKKLWIR